MSDLLVAIHLVKLSLNIAVAAHGKTVHTNFQTRLKADVALYKNGLISWCVLTKRLSHPRKLCLSSCQPRPIFGLTFGKKTPRWTWFSHPSRHALVVLPALVSPRLTCMMICLSIPCERPRRSMLPPARLAPTVGIHVVWLGCLIASSCGGWCCSASVSGEVSGLPRFSWL